MGITKPSTHLHPAPSTSTQLISTFTQLHLPPPSSLQHPQQYLNQNITCNWAISPNLVRKIKLSILTENWHTWYFGEADSQSRLRFLKFRPQNQFLGKFGPKNSKLSILSENWQIWYLKDADSHSNIIFLNFKSQFPCWANLGSKTQSCPVWLKIGTQSVSTLLIHIPTFFSVLNHKSFLDKFGQKNLKLFILTENWHI